MQTLTPVALSLGSNLGDRRGHLEWALEQLGRRLERLRVSSVIETDAEDVPDPQPPYLNAAAVGETALEPGPLLDLLLDLERARGRERRAFRAARTLDLDLIFYGTRVIDTPALVVPHPHFRTRGFVLAPLAEIAPDWIDPLTGKTVGKTLEELRTQNLELRTAGSVRSPAF